MVTHAQLFFGRTCTTLFGLHRQPFFLGTPTPCLVTHTHTPFFVKHTPFLFRHTHTPFFWVTHTPFFGHTHTHLFFGYTHTLLLGYTHTLLGHTICWRIVTRMLSNCSKMFILGTNWKAWYSMVSEQTCTIDYEMDQGLWQTPESIDFIYSSYMWIQSILLCG